MTDSKAIPKEAIEYCPMCQRHITASNVEEVMDGDSNSYMFVHDNVPHTVTDVEALMRGVQ